MRAPPPALFDIQERRLYGNIYILTACLSGLPDLPIRKPRTHRCMVYANQCPAL